MAYLRDLELKCDLCKTATAKVELMDRWNGARGRYCRKCGAIRLKAHKNNEEG